MGNKKEITIGLFFLILTLTIPSIYAEPAQVTSTISLKPYYLPSLTANTNYTFTFQINPVDKYSQTLSAIVKFQNYMSPAITYNLWIDGKTCNPVAHTISTTYSNSQQAEFSFDCSNIINHTGNYTAKLQTNKNAGSITASLEHNYINNADGKAYVHGTEYNAGEPAKVWLQLLNSSNDAVTNGICYADIYTPDNEEYLERVEMTNMNHDGIYYYDLIAPSVIGVYPVIATCYYQATENIYNATNYFTEFGTYNAGLITDTLTQDGNFLRFKETSTINPRNISVGLNFTNLNGCVATNENFLTGINIHTYMKFDSVTDDDITISIYNHTSNTWMDLPNLHLESTSFTTTSNVIDLNNLTKSGLYANNKGINIRFRDTQLADGTQSNLDIDHAYISCLQLANPTWTEVKGSSEIHIGISDDGLLFHTNTLCNLEDLSGECAYFFQNTTLMPEPQGLIYENITIINIGNTGTSGTLTYNTGSTIDCSAIISVIAYHNGSTIDKTNSTFYSLGNGLDNCALKIPIDLNVNEESFNMEIIMENYALWEVYRANDILGVMNTSNSEFCQQFNYTYEIPIESILNKTGMDLFCNRILDDQYWYDTLVRNEAVNVNTIGEFESIITELRFYYPEIVDAYFFVEAIKRSNNQVNTLNLTQEIYDLIINQSINVSFNETQNLINIQTANILSAISSSTNLSTMEYNLLNQTIYSQIATLSNQINSNTTQIQTLINSQVNIILNTIDYYHNLTTAEIQSLNATMTSQYNNVIANQNTIISITNQINATTLANQLAIQNILAQLNATNIQIQYLNSTMLQILNQTQTNENWLTQIWNYITSYLTNLTLNINQTTTINQNLLNQLLNQTNTTLYPVIIQYNETNCLSGGAWNIQAIVLNQNNQLMTPPYANCQITTDITGTNNMTFNYPYYTYNTICPSPQAWNWTITCV